MMVRKKQTREIKSPDLSNVTSLEEFKARPKTAGKEPPDGGKDWLSGMATGTEFLIRDRWGSLTPKWVVLEWIFGGLHPTGNVLLLPMKTPNDPKTWQWVHPAEFCKAFEFRGIVDIPVLETEHESDSGTTQLEP